jgi:hypothetical protein
MRPRERSLEYWAGLGLKIEQGEVSKEELSFWDICKARTALEQVRKDIDRTWPGQRGGAERAMPIRREIVLAGEVGTAQGKPSKIVFSKGSKGIIKLARKFPRVKEMVERACGMDVKGELNN